MAVDTQNKRASVIGLADPVSAVFPVPIGLIASAAEREQLGYSYIGFAVEFSLPLQPIVAVVEAPIGIGYAVVLA